MKSINELQQEIAQACLAKYPNNASWTGQDKVLSSLRQLADVGGAIQKEQGIYPNDSSVYDDVDHRLACLLADIFILCEERGMDTEAELEKVLTWYQGHAEGTTNRT